MASAASGLAVAGPINFGAIARAKSRPLAAGGRFAYGVASGFPSTTQITLWTRVAGLQASARVAYEVATDAQFRQVVAHGESLADAGKDFTVHTPVHGLRPAHEYHYRFATRHGHSRVGRFRTLPPADSRQTLRIGFYSCSSYEAGYYTALAGLANEPDLDLVLCLGDYIYEHHYYDGPPARRDRTGTNHDGDVQSLAEYRQKYRLYQADPHLQDMHAAYPFVSLWDDHEVEDNYAGSSPDSSSPNPKLREQWLSRGACRSPSGGATATGRSSRRCRDCRTAAIPNRIYGSVRLGQMAELYLTDERQYRDPAAVHGRAAAPPCPDDL